MILLSEKSEKPDRNRISIMTKVKQRKHQFPQQLVLKLLWNRQVSKKDRRLLILGETDETVETFHRNLLLLLPTIL